jgi:diadenosine tetraphosphatase ApaH/serine/threonine PP2A family protein phosphatase
MRLLLISDIHSNIEALEAVLNAAPDHDEVVDLGDVVGYGASPNEVVDRIRALKAARHVRGNHDKACAGVMSTEQFNPIAAIAAYWTRDMLSPTNRKWLANMPSGPVQHDGLSDVQFVHGSPLDEDDYLITPVDAAFAAPEITARVTFFGHTHIQGGFVLHAPAAEAIRLKVQSGPEELDFKPGARYLINPGSVGQPRDGDPRAAYAIYDTETDSVAFHRVSYDIESAQKRIIEAQLPERLATRLKDGR